MNRSVMLDRQAWRVDLEFQGESREWSVEPCAPLCPAAHDLAIIRARDTLRGVKTTVALEIGRTTPQWDHATQALQIYQSQGALPGRTCRRYHPGWMSRKP